MYYLSRTKNVVSASKMFSKIRNRIKSKPLKINLKTTKPLEGDDDGPGLDGRTGKLLTDIPTNQQIDRPTNRPTDEYEGSCQREVTLPIIRIWYRVYNNQ